ncbi:hypothetical protein LCGC14_1923560 [marine sediment metagenome]|uniref:Uncharacterized protein n=1 Tax=marine sediment metagenome TaxID=412755 RepID=A0A0F9I3Y9_9ZZZZ|nr:hypothetical protein [Porticoccus sp.]
MKIQVWKRYDENRAKKPIEEGVYNDGDRKLQGLARYLIDNGNAREYVEPVVEAIEEPEELQPDWPRIEDEARDLTVENDKIRKANVKPKRTRARKAKA